MKKSSSFRGTAYSCALAMLLSGCGSVPAAPPQTTPKTAETATAQLYTGSTRVQDVINDAAFGDYGRDFPGGPDNSRRPDAGKS